MTFKLLFREAATLPDLILRDARPQPGTFNAEAHTIEAVIATDHAVDRRDAQGPYREILDPAGLDLQALHGAPVLNSHRQGDVAHVFGTVASARLEGNQVVATIRFSKRPDVAHVVEDVRSGVLNSFSVGYQVNEWKDGKDAQGRRTKTGTKWVAREVSLVGVPADPNCRTREADPAPDRAEVNRSIREIGTRIGVASTLIDSLIDRGASIHEAREAILNDMTARGPAHITSTRHNVASMDNPDALVRAMGEALFTRVDPTFTPSDAARQFVGMSIPEMARDMLRRSGVSTSGMSADTLITRSLGGLHTTSDFANLMGNVADRSLRQAYAIPRSDIKMVARQTTAADFRRKTRIQLDSSGLTLEKVNEAGEFRSGTLVDSAESYALQTFGRIVGISRQALINDDLGGFSDLTRRLGQAAASFESEFLASLLTSNNGLGPVMSDAFNLFTVIHGNVSATGAPPDQNGLSAARLAMRRQTGPSGGVISVTPKFLVVPPELETTAEKLITAIQAVEELNVNVFSNLTLVVEPRLTNPYRWYLAADPAEIDGLEFAYLAGAPGPQIQTEVGFRVDGVEVKVRTDFGAGFVDYRSWYSNAGQ